MHVRPSPQAVPLAAGCLKANLPEQLRQNCQLLDLYAEQNDAEILQTILDRQPQVVAFPLYLWNRTRLLALCRKLRETEPRLFLLAGGPEASADSARVIAEGNLDGVICGEGEMVFAELMTALASGQPPAATLGFLPAAAALEQKPQDALCPDLAALPSPWLQGDLPLAAGGGVLWEVARGCHFNCAFCYDAKGQQGVRPLPWQRLQAELALFVAKGISQVWILDSTFNAPPERGQQLLRLLAEQAPGIHFHLEAKADFLDAETAQLLSQISCSLQIGLQAADPAVLTPLQRGFNPQQMRKALELLSHAGVTFGLDLIYGLPGDNHDGFCRSLDFALRQQPNQVDIFPLAVLPGTTLYRQQQDYGIRAAAEPPYLIEENLSYPPEQLQQSRQLALATDIFYNRGRAVGFFLQLCEALRQQPAQLLENFADWLSSQAQLNSEQITSAECWQPAEILPLQRQFIAEGLQRAGLQKLEPLCDDLLHYHFCSAETLLAAECRPSSAAPTTKQRRRLRWRLHPGVRLQYFHYALEELEHYGGLPLAKIHLQLKAEPSWVVFLQRGGEILCEAVQDEFAELLLASRTAQTGELLLNRLADGEELLEFAVAEGLLQQVT